jgi:hypothetical protein
MILGYRLQLMGFSQKLINQVNFSFRMVERGETLVVRDRNREAGTDWLFCPQGE